MLDRFFGVARACACSIACRVSSRGVGPLARRRACRGGRLGVFGCAGVGAGSAGSARVPVSVGRVAGGRDPGHRGGDARLCRVRDLGGHGTVGSARPAGDSVPPPEREDVPVGVVAAGSGRSGPPPRRLLHRNGHRADRAAGGRGGRQDAARRAADGRDRHASGVGVRPSRATGARTTRRRREEQRDPLVRKLLRAFRRVRLLVTIACHAHPGRDRAADLRHACDRTT